MIMPNRGGAVEWFKDNFMLNGDLALEVEIILNLDATSVFVQSSDRTGLMIFDHSGRFRCLFHEIIEKAWISVVYLISCILAKPKMENLLIYSPAFWLSLVGCLA